MSEPDVSEGFAMDALRAGDEAAWTAFFAQFDGSIRAVVAWPKWRFDPHTREDVAQAIRMGIMHSMERLQSEQSLQAFVRKICINRCIDMLRKQLREQNRLVPLGHWNEDGEWEDVDVAAGPEFDPVATLQRAERAAVLRSALARMDEPSQTLIRQFYVEGLSYREIALRQGVAVNTVGSRLSRCLDKLRELLKQTEVAR
ncbi:MAG: sigma-70 family RNA polymerase sigma factor [bacterium]